MVEEAVTLVHALIISSFSSLKHLFPPPPPPKQNLSMLFHLSKGLRSALYSVDFSSSPAASQPLA
eukprot:11258326-Ditylum_brightwellii.AAC.1